MANSSIQIPEAAYAGFDALVQIGPEKLRTLANEFQDKQLSLEIGLLIDDLAEAHGVETNLLDQAVNDVLIPLSGLRSDFGMQGDEFLELVLDSAKQQKSDWWDRLNQQGWRAVCGVVAELIAADGYFALLNKAYRLLVNRPALVTSLRLLTELRPVFDDEVSAVQAYLITSTLSVNFRESGRRRQVHLTLDQADLEKLRDQVDRALKKIALLEAQATKSGVPALVAGTERS
jgi:hypothetical protein